MRIVQTANFVSPTSGGLRTAVTALGRGYVAAGHERILVVPGAVDADVTTSAGRVITLRAPEVRGTGGYRLILDRRRLRRVLEEVAPDRLEVSDRTTLRWLGRWARDEGVPAVAMVHERLDQWLRMWLPSWLPLGTAADLSNARLAARFDTIVCTTRWGCAEFERIGVPHLVQVPLGVDLDTFTPERYDPGLRTRLADDDELLLVHCSRLSGEKRPDLPVALVRHLVERGQRVRLVVAGDGPQRAALQRSAAGLPVTYLGYLGERSAVAALLATADVVVAPGPVETFGLAALEAMASGTPVLTSCRGALPEMLAPNAGVAACARPESMARGLRRILEVDELTRRQAARRRAEEFPWSRSVEGMLAVHGRRAVKRSEDVARMLHLGNPAAMSAPANGAGNRRTAERTSS